MKQRTWVDSSAPRRGVVFAVTALGAFMASLDLSIVNVAFPALERAFPHVPTATLAWVITGYAIVFGSLLVVAGRTADRLGARRIFFTGLLVFTAGSALAGSAPSAIVLVGGRVIQGVGAAALLPASLSLLLATYPSERRSQVVALWGGIGALAVATGPSLGALLITYWGWRAAFFVNVPVAAVAVVLGRRHLPATARRPGESIPDYLGVALLTTGLALLVLAISEGPTWGWTSPRIVGSFLGFAVLAVGLVVRAAHHPEPVLDLVLFSSRSFSIANAAMVFYAMGFFSMLLGNILFLTSTWHYSILRAGLAVTPGPLVVATISGPVGKLSRRVGFRPILLTGAGVLAVGLASYGVRVTAHPAYLAVWLPATLVVGLGVGLTFPILSATAVSSLPPHRYAVGSAINQTGRQVGGAIGVAILVVITGSPTSAAQSVARFHDLWFFAAAVVALSGLVVLPLGRAGRADVRLPDPLPAVALDRAD